VIGRAEAEGRATDKDDVVERVLRVCEATISLGERREAPRVIYFGTSRRQIVCPHIRSATENSVVTSDSRCSRCCRRRRSRRRRRRHRHRLRRCSSVAPFSRVRGSNCIVSLSLSLSVAHPITLRTDAQLSPRVCTPARDRTWVLYVPDVSSESEGRFHQRRVTLTLSSAGPLPTRGDGRERGTTVSSRGSPFPLEARDQLVVGRLDRTASGANDICPFSIFIPRTSLGSGGDGGGGGGRRQTLPPKATIRIASV